MTIEESKNLNTEEQTTELCLKENGQYLFGPIQYIDEKLPNICFETVKKDLDLFYKIPINYLQNLLLL